MMSSDAVMTFVGHCFSGFPIRDTVGLIQIQKKAACCVVSAEAKDVDAGTSGSRVEMRVSSADKFLGRVLRVV